VVFFNCVSFSDQRAGLVARSEDFGPRARRFADRVHPVRGRVSRNRNRTLQCGSRFWKLHHQQVFVVQGISFADVNFFVVVVYRVVVTFVFVVVVYRAVVVVSVLLLCIVLLLLMLMFLLLLLLLLLLMLMVLLLLVLFYCVACFCCFCCCCCSFVVYRVVVDRAFVLIVSDSAETKSKLVTNVRNL
jgi:hypothetical protein